VATLPRTESGKVDLGAVRAIFRPTEPTEPSEPIEQRT
jgi:hypothetical protein